MKILKLLLLFAVMFIATSLCAQSAFKRLPIPNNASAKNFSLAPVSNEITAYRFTLPFAGYSPFTKQISTGLGFGYNRLHFVDSTQRYYTDFSIFAAIFANGNITPSPYNYASVGIGVGFLNNLIMITPAFNLPNSDHPKGAFDLKISFGVPLN